MKLGLGLSSAKGSGKPWSVRDLGPAIWLDATVGSSIRNGSSAATNGQTIDEWRDLSGNANHLTPPNTNKPVYYTAGGPTDGPRVEFTDDILRKAALAATVTNPTVIFVGRINTTGTAVGDYIYSGDGTPNFYLQNFGTAVLGSAPSCSNMAVTKDVWLMHLFEANEGAGGWRLDDSQIKVAPTPHSAIAIDDFYLGGSSSASNKAAFDIVELIVVPGKIPDSDLSKLRSYLSSKYNFGWSEEYRFLDTFTRANTSDSVIGEGETAHPWTGQSAATRILDGTMTIVSPYTTTYCFPQINFAPAQIGWDYTTRNGGGSALSVCALLICKNNTSTKQNDMFHLVWGVNGWFLERYYIDGTVKHETVAQRTYTSPVLAGSFTVVPDWAAGTVSVTDAEGVTTIGDWNANTSLDLVNYKTPFVAYEILMQAGTPADIVQYTRCWAYR